MLELRRNLAREIIKELKEKEGVVLPLSSVIQMIKTQGAAIRYAATKKESINILYFGKLEYNKAKSDKKKRIHASLREGKTYQEAMNIEHALNKNNGDTEIK